MIYATQPTLSGLFAVKEAMSRSQPNQLTADGKHGIKIYFLDKQILPQPVYGNKYALGLYIPQDKDRHISMYITPDGAKAPPTAKDVFLNCFQKAPRSVEYSDSGCVEKVFQIICKLNIISVASLIGSASR